MGFIFHFARFPELPYHEKKNICADRLLKYLSISYWVYLLGYISPLQLSAGGLEVKSILYPFREEGSQINNLW